MSRRAIEDPQFRAVVAFHGCYCLDIAMGYRVAKALLREMGDDVENMKEVVAQVGTRTCAIDAIQQLAGCTVGKRNLHVTDVGKSVFVLQNTRTGRAVRAYCHYWDHFDHDGLQAKRQALKAANVSDDERAAFDTWLDEKMTAILEAPEDELFVLSSVSLPGPPHYGKYKSRPCGRCGEYTKDGLLVECDGDRICRECAG